MSSGNRRHRLTTSSAGRSPPLPQIADGPGDRPLQRYAEDSALHFECGLRGRRRENGPDISTYIPDSRPRYH
jgi:hypothetical protein